MCRPAAFVIIAIQSILLFLSAGIDRGKTDDHSARNFAIDYAPKYSFSGEKNVILIVLDAYQSDIFFEIISSEPKYADYFQGFTYFRNAVAGSNYTELAIPALLTGRIFDNSQHREDFLREAFLNFGITCKAIERFSLKSEILWKIKCELHKNEDIIQACPKDHISWKMFFRIVVTL